MTNAPQIQTLDEFESVAPAAISAQEFANLSRLSKQTVCKMLRNGDIEGVRIGRSWRIPARVVRESLLIDAE